MFPLEKRTLIRGCEAHIKAGLGCATDYVADYVNLYAPFNGWLIIPYSDGGGGGNWLRLNRENGDKIEFAHLSERYITDGFVKEGTLMGKTGNTGTITSGPHLHIQIINNGVRLDPEQYNWNMMPKINIKVIREEREEHKQKVDDAIHNAWKFFADRGIDTDWNSDDEHILVKCISKESTGGNATQVKPYVVEFHVGDIGHPPAQALIHEITHIMWSETGLGCMHNCVGADPVADVLTGNMLEMNKYTTTRFLEVFNPAIHFKLETNNDIITDMKLYEDSNKRVWAVQEDKKFWVLDPNTRDALKLVAGEPSKVDVVPGIYAGALGWFNTDEPK